MKECSPIDMVRTAATVKKYTGDINMAALTEFFLSRTAYLVIRYRVAPKPPANAGAMIIPAQMVARPFPPFQPHCGASQPPTATPTPARAETSE